MNKNKQQILEEIITLAEQCGSYIDAIVEVSERYHVEIETISQYIRYSRDIKEKLRQEGLSLKMLEPEDEPV